jgi:hypothetical protein
MALPPCAMVARLAVCAAIAAHIASAQTPPTPLQSGVAVWVLSPPLAQGSSREYSVEWPANGVALSVELLAVGGEPNMVVSAGSPAVVVATANAPGSDVFSGSAATTGWLATGPQVRERDGGGGDVRLSRPLHPGDGCATFVPAAAVAVGF